MHLFAGIDQTQEALTPHLAATEELLKRAVCSVSGREESAEIILMPDLGLPNSVQRMAGGFFTGMLAHWTCLEPFVPVDATVNVCSVAIYRLVQDQGDIEAMRHRVASMEGAGYGATCYEMNFSQGNHFATVFAADGAGALAAGRYLVLHSSACEFKKQHHGLYPEPGNWYADAVQTVTDPGSSRYLRFLRGRRAERFIRLARSLEEFNRHRLHYFADRFAGGETEEILYRPHYGMPTGDSVAIGCQWLLDESEAAVLLTAPGCDIYVVKPQRGTPCSVMMGGQRLSLLPHGLGNRSLAPLSVGYAPDGIEINGRMWGRSGSIKRYDEFCIRGSAGTMSSVVRDVLALSPADMMCTLFPIATFF